MATSFVCDICGVDAVDTITVKSLTTTEIKKDVCVEHLAIFKKSMRLFTGQDFEEKKDAQTFLESKGFVEEAIVQPE